MRVRVIRDRLERTDDGDVVQAEPQLLGGVVEEADGLVGRRVERRERVEHLAREPTGADDEERTSGHRAGLSHGCGAVWLVV